MRIRHIAPALTLSVGFFGPACSGPEAHNSAPPAAESTAPHMKDIETPGVYLMNIGDKVTITQGEQDVATLAKNAGVRAICLAFNVERPHSSLIGVSWDGDTAYVPLYKPGQDPAGEPLSLEPQFEPRYPEEESFSELEAC